LFSRRLEANVPGYSLLFKMQRVNASSLAAAAPDGLFDHPAGWVLSENFAPIGT
jgi:hypothetical protein